MIEDVIELNDVDLKLYYQLGKMVKEEFKRKFPTLREKPVLISMGYIAVFNEVKKEKSSIFMLMVCS